MATVRQKKAIKNLSENGGILSRAMLDAGYSPITAKTPQKLTQSKAWREYMDEHLPESLLAEKHRQLLESTNLERLSFDTDSRDEDIENVIAKMPGYELLHIVRREGANGAYDSVYAYVKAPDNMTQDKALDKAYKLRGSYAPEKSVNLNINANDESKGKAKEIIRGFIEST